MAGSQLLQALGDMSENMAGDDSHLNSICLLGSRYIDMTKVPLVYLWKWIILIVEQMLRVDKITACFMCPEPD